MWKLIDTDLAQEQERNDRGEECADDEGGADHSVRPNPEHSRHLKILGGGAHLHAERRLLQEQDQKRQQPKGDDNRHKLQTGDSQIADGDGFSQTRPNPDRLGPRGVDDDDGVLDNVAHPERCDHQHRRRRLAQRAKNQIFADQRDDHDDSRARQ